MTTKYFTSRAFWLSLLIGFALIGGCLCTLPSQAFAKTSEELFAEADAIMLEIDRLQTDINIEQESYDTALADYEAATAAAEEAKKRIAEEQEQLDFYQSQLSALVTDMYKKGGSSDFLEVFLGSASFDDFLIQWDAISSISGQGAEFVREAKIAKAAQEEAKAEYDKQSKKASKRMSSAEASMEKIESKREQLIAEAEKLTEDAKELQAQEELEREAALQAAAAAEALWIAEEEARLAAEERVAQALEAGEELDLEEEIERYTGELVISGTGLLNHPLPTGSPSSPFGWRELDGGTYHLGFDIAASEGTPYYAAANGTVVYTTTDGGYNGGAGNIIVIAHGNGLVTKYMHSSKVFVKAGESVSRGQKIGAVGNTGHSYGAHLHFQVEYNGVPVDPTLLL